MSYETLHSKSVPNTECHHLISRGALNRWRYYLKDHECQVPEWLDDDLQRWAPAIRMTKAHHAKTASYYNPEKMDLQALSKAGQYITDQGELLIKGKIQACFDMEVELINKTFKDKYAKELQAASEYFTNFLKEHELPDAKPASPAPTEYATKAELEAVKADIGKILTFMETHL